MIPSRWHWIGLLEFQLVGCPDENQLSFVGCPPTKAATVLCLRSHLSKEFQKPQGRRGLVTQMYPMELAGMDLHSCIAKITINKGYP